MTKLSSTRLSNFRRIDQIIKTGKSYKLSWCKLTYLPSVNFTYTISISKKISKKAVVRNLIKRRIKHAILSSIKDLSSKSSSLHPINLLILVYPEVIEIEYQIMKSEILKFLTNTQSSHSNLISERTQHSQVQEIKN